MKDLGLVAVSEPMPPGGGEIVGSSPLGGNLTLASLLVRESVQNSWDARDDQRGDRPVLFEIQGWDLDTDRLDHLRALLPVEELEGFTRTAEDDKQNGALHPSAVLAHAKVQLLVISDRNTVGLCGPTRSGQRWDPVRRGVALERGQQRFANFIRNTGRASSDTGHGDGGAFGVGKSALWMASHCGTILVHTRTTDERGDPQERFIGSIHGDHFYSKDGTEHTGRHFVGRRSGDGVVEPLVGADAAAAVEGLPCPPYNDEGSYTDGTTIFIVAPRLTLSWATEMQRIRDAVRWQVWPKLVPGARMGTERPDMEIRLGWNGNPVVLTGPLDDPEIRPYAKALLDCARERREPEEYRDIEARCGSPSKTLGHIRFRNAGLADQNVFHVTMTSSELEEADGGADVEPAVDFERPWGQIALVRREPLLLVRYEPIGGPDAAANEVGVFLSADDPEVEAALTNAEPPAHDDWIYRNVPKDHPRDWRRTFAKKTLDEIKRAKKLLVASFHSASEGTHGGGEQHVSKAISQHLIGGLGGGRRPSSKVDGHGGAGGPRADLKLVRTDVDGTVVTHEVDVTITGVGGEERDVELAADASAVDNAGTMQPEGHVSFGWIRPDGSMLPGPTLATRARDDSRFALVVHVSGHLRVRPRVKVAI